jgi:dephospho-CoA kinase
MLRDGSTQADAQARIDAQLPLAQKQRLAHVVIRNDGDIQQLQEQVRASRTAQWTLADSHPSFTGLLGSSAGS